MKTISFTKTLFDIKADFYKDCSIIIESSLEGNLKKFNYILYEKTKHLSEEERDIATNYTYNYSNETFDIFKSTEFFQINRSAIFLRIYSHFEASLKLFCIERVNEIEYEKRIKNIRGKGIFLYKNFLEKETKLSFKNITSIWKDISRYNKIRNSLAHTSGIIYDDKEAEQIKKICNQTDGVDFDNDAREIVIHKNFIENVITNLKSFYEQLEIQL